MLKKLFPPAPDGQIGLIKHLLLNGILPIIATIFLFSQMFKAVPEGGSNTIWIAIFCITVVVLGFSRLRVIFTGNGTAWVITLFLSMILGVFVWLGWFLMGFVFIVLDVIRLIVNRDTTKNDISLDES